MRRRVAIFYFVFAFIILYWEVRSGDSGYSYSSLVDTGAAEWWNLRADVINEQFETWPPAGWTITGGSGQCMWQTGSMSIDPNYTGGSGDYADADSDACGGLMDSSLLTPAFSLIGYAQATVTFKSDMRFFLTDTWDVDCSTDGGNTWNINLLHRSGADYRGPETLSLELTPALGQANVKIRFHYTTLDWGYWWQVDEVLITAFTVPTTPTPYLTPTPTNTPTRTPTQQFTNTPTITLTRTPTRTMTRTPTRTYTPSPTQAQSVTITMTPTITLTPTPGAGSLDCSSPVLLTCGVPYSSTTVGLTNRVSFYNCFNDQVNGPEKVHKLTLTGSVPYRITVQLSSLTTDMMVFLLDSCNEDDCQAYREGNGSVSYVYAAQNNDIYIVMDSEAGQQSSYTLNVLCATVTQTATSTRTPTITATLTPAASATSTRTPTATLTRTPTRTPVGTILPYRPVPAINFFGLILLISIISFLQVWRKR